MSELSDLRDRLSNARDELNGMADRTADRGGDWQRVASKAEGVDLALGYVCEMLARGAGAAYLGVAAEHHEAIELARRIVAKGESLCAVLASGLVAIDEAMRSELTADQ